MAETSPSSDQLTVQQPDARQERIRQEARIINAIAAGPQDPDTPLPHYPYGSQRLREILTSHSDKYPKGGPKHTNLSLAIRQLEREEELAEIASRRDTRESRLVRPRAEDTNTTTRENDPLPPTGNDITAELPAAAAETESTPPVNTPAPTAADTNTDTNTDENDPRFPRLERLAQITRVAHLAKMIRPSRNRTHDTKEHRAALAPFTDQEVNRITEFDSIRFTPEATIIVPANLITFDELGIREPIPNHLYYNLKQGRKTITIDAIGNIADLRRDKEPYKYAFHAKFPKKDALILINALSQGGEIANEALRRLEGHDRELVKDTTGLSPTTLIPEFTIDTCEERSKEKPPKEKPLDKGEKEHVDWMKDLINTPANPDLKPRAGKGFSTAEQQRIEAAEPGRRDDEPTQIGDEPASVSEEVAEHTDERTPEQSRPEIPTTPEALREWREAIAQTLQETTIIHYRSGQSEMYYAPDPNDNTKLDSIFYRSNDTRFTSVQQHLLSDASVATEDVVRDLADACEIKPPYENKIFAAADSASHEIEIGYQEDTPMTWKLSFTDEAAYADFLNYLKTSPNTTIGMTFLRAGEYYDRNGEFTDYVKSSTATEINKQHIANAQNAKAVFEGSKTIPQEGNSDGRSIDLLAWTVEPTTQTTETGEEPPVEGDDMHAILESASDFEEAQSLEEPRLYNELAKNLDIPVEKLTDVQRELIDVIALVEDEEVFQKDALNTLAQSIKAANPNYQNDNVDLVSREGKIYQIIGVRDPLNLRENPDDHTIQELREQLGVTIREIPQDSDSTVLTQGKTKLFTVDNFILWLGPRR